MESGIGELRERGKEVKGKGKREEGPGGKKKRRKKVVKKAFGFLRTSSSRRLRPVTVGREKSEDYNTALNDSLLFHTINKHVLVTLCFI